MPYADVAGRQVHYARRGQGDPLVLIMGMGGSHVSWGEPFLAALERDFDVIAPDNRGMGLSKADVKGGFSVADLAADVAALMEAVGQPSAHVLGVSLGGMIAQELALAHPERIRTLALGCTYAGGPDSTQMPQEVASRLFAGWTSGDRERALRTGYEVNLSAAFRADESRFDAFHAMATTFPAAIEVIMLQAQAGLAHDTSGRLEAITAPTLVIHGTDDQLLPYANGELIASRVPAARLATMEGVGHMFWWEQPERAAALLREHALSEPAQAA